MKKINLAIIITFILTYSVFIAGDDTKMSYKDTNASYIKSEYMKYFYRIDGNKKYLFKLVAIDTSIYNQKVYFEYTDLNINEPQKIEGIAMSLGYDGEVWEDADGYGYYVLEYHYYTCQDSCHSYINYDLDHDRVLLRPDSCFLHKYPNLKDVYNKWLYRDSTGLK